VTGWTAWARRIVWTPASERPKWPDLTFLNQVLHRPGNVFDRHVRVNPMLIEEIDVIGLQSFERGFSYLLNMLRTAIRAALFWRPSNVNPNLVAITT